MSVALQMTLYLSPICPLVALTGVFQTLLFLSSEN